MGPSSSSTGSLASPGGPSRPRRRLAVGAVAAAGLGAGVLALLAPHRAVTPVPERVAHSYVDAWNARDAQAVSALTCRYPPAYVAPGDVQHALDRLPADRPVVRTHTVLGTHPDTAYGRPGTAVVIAWTPGSGGPPRRQELFVRDADGADPCIGYFVSW